MRFRPTRQAGFTLIEVLVVVTMLAALMILFALSLRKQTQQGYDGKRKADFARLKVAFEDYYNDKGCYPQPALLQSCDSSALSPWIPKVLCDPETHQPYPYYLDSSCKWFALFTTLGDTKDPMIRALSCSPTCGVLGQTYNFVQTNGGVQLGDILTSINGGGGAGGTPSPAPGSQTAYACDSLGQCNIYFNPAANGCPVTFQDPATCAAACGTVSNRCTR